MRFCLFSSPRFKFLSKFSSYLISILIIINLVFFAPLAYSLENYSNFINLPDPGRMLETTAAYKPALIKGMTIHPENPLLFDFIVEPGDSRLSGASLNEEALRMVKYFLGSLTIPDKEMWVNLSPNEPNRIIPEGLGSTVLGRDLLSQDYILKQFTSSLMYPEKEVGKEFWERVYQKAYEQFGTTNIPLDTYNKVWVVPSKAAVYEEGNTVYIVKRVLKVMLEKDYLSMEKNESVRDSQASGESTLEKASQEKTISEQVLREIIIPELEKEINEGRYFANLRQIYNAMILAKWYKETARESLLGKVYDDQNKVEGINNDDPLIKEKIYDQYLAAFKKGVYSIIREEYDPGEEAVIPRKYFSGGLWGLQDLPLKVYTPDNKDEMDPAMVTEVEIKDGFLSFKVQMTELGAQADPQAVRQIKAHKYYRRPFDALANVTGQKLIRDGLKGFQTKKYTMLHVGEEYMIPALKENAEFIASGGLGFLAGEHSASGQEMFETALAAVTFAYKNRKNTKTGEYEKIDYPKLPNVYPLMIETPNGSIQHKFPVDFKGNYNGEVLGKRYGAETFYLDNDNNPMFLLSLPDEPNLYHHLYDSYNNDEKRWIQYGLNARQIVEFIKNSGAAPDVLHLNEGHMVFLYPAIRNDIEFYRQRGEKSIFEGIKIIYTNHTPEWAGIPATGDIENLRKRVGPALLPDYMLTDGHFNSLEAMVQNALYADPKETGVELIVNGVSKEHYEVLIQLLLKRFPDAHKVVTYVQNGSRVKDWISDRLKAAIDQHGLEGITGEMLLDIAEQNKLEINEGLRKLYGEEAPQFDEDLLKKRPIIAFLRRWVEYKEAGVLLPLIKWIVGDKEKIYRHPEILDFSVLEDPEKLEEALKNAKWVEGPGLEMLVLAGGKPQGEPIGERWLKEFKSLSEEPEVKGRMLVIEDTGFPIMKLAAAGTTFLYNVPDLTREASGTSQQRWGFNGKLVMAILGAGMSAQIEHLKSGWILNPFPVKTLDEMIQDFNPSDPERISAARGEFRKRVAVLDAAYLVDAVDLYYNNREELAKRMLSSFRYAHDTVDMKRQVREYEALGISMANGQGKEGFDKMRKRMYLENLLANVYTWHPELKTKGTTLKDLQQLIAETWSPLDQLELGEKELKTLIGVDSNTEEFLLANGMERSEDGLWRPTETTFKPKYLELFDKKESPKEEDNAIAINPKNEVNSYGGINLDSQLLDLQIKRNGEGIPLPLLEQPIDQMKIEGFIPIIINVEPYAFPMKD